MMKEIVDNLIYIVDEMVIFCGDKITFNSTYRGTG